MDELCHPDAAANSAARRLRRLPLPPVSERGHRGHTRAEDERGTGSGVGGPAAGVPEEANEGRTIEVDVRHHLLAANDRHADGIRMVLRAHGVFCVNVMSSPGSGKTALLEATLARAGKDLRFAVIEGDIETTADADRLSPYGVPVIQINTGPFGGDCHLAAPLVAGAIEQLDLHALDLVLIENVGNLVCPAEFDIGEDHKVVLLSVTEGEDKPLKYPLMFHEASLALVTKVDLLPYLDADMDLIRANLRAVNPRLEVLAVSSKSGDGLPRWLDWLRRAVFAKRCQTGGA